MSNTRPIFRTNRNREFSGSYIPTVAKRFLTEGETYTAPPSTNDNEVAVLNVNTDTWRIVKDFRGTVYYTPDGKKQTITTLGQTTPTNAIMEAPETVYHDSYDYVEREWVFNYTRCRQDLYTQIENEKRKAQTQGLNIEGVIWDSDQMAEIRLTQLWLVFIENSEFETPVFYANEDTPIVMNLRVHRGWRNANQHNLQNIFKWRSETRQAILETRNVKELMRYFDTLKFIPTEYTIDGVPKEG